MGTGVSAAAPAAGVLIGGRALQGSGAALASTAALSLVATLLPEGPRRRKAFALFGFMTSIGSVLGLMLGGALTSLTGWRTIFLPSFALSTALTLGAARLVPSDARRVVWRRFDLPGALTVSVGIGLLAYGISHSQDTGFGSPSTVGALAAAAVLISTFVVIERRSVTPLLPPPMLTRRTIVSALLATLPIWAGFASLFFHMSFLLQWLLHYTPLQSALAYLPLAVTTALSSRIAARFGHRQPGWLVLVGAACIASASVLLSRLTADTGYVAGVLPGLLLAGAGLGLAIVSIQIVMFHGAASQTTGVLSGLLTTTQETASGVGTTVLATLAVAIGGVAGIKSALLWGAGVALAGGLLGVALTPRDTLRR